MPPSSDLYPGGNLFDAGGPLAPERGKKTCEEVGDESKEHPFDGEYSDKRVVLTSPEGLEVVVELKFEDGWGVVIEFPKGFQAEAQERHIPDGPWTK